jgi:phage regulator Rha-like protein
MKKEPNTKETVILKTGGAERMIYFIRGQAVMISTDLASFYGVKPKALVQSVTRNINRFPADFMFQLTSDEVKNLKSQFVTSSWGGARRANPYAFTELGVAMLSSVLRSETAVQVNIEIMRAFVRMKKALLADRELSRRMDKVERNISEIDSDHANTKKQVRILSSVVQSLIDPPFTPMRKIGFRKKD